MKEVTVYGTLVWSKQVLTRSSRGTPKLHTAEFRASGSGFRVQGVGFRAVGVVLNVRSACICLHDKPKPWQTPKA